MQKVETARDFQGHQMEKGDTVALLSDNSSARVADLAREGDQLFVRLRPLHQPYGKGVWHAADQVVWLATSRKNKDKAKEKTNDKGKVKQTAKASESARKKSAQATRSSRGKVTKHK